MCRKCLFGLIFPFTNSNFNQNCFNEILLISVIKLKSRKIKRRNAIETVRFFSLWSTDILYCFDIWFTYKLHFMDVKFPWLRTIICFHGRVSCHGNCETNCGFPWFQICMLMHIAWPYMAGYFAMAVVKLWVSMDSKTHVIQW